jgi:uncharacterized protein
MEGDKKFAADAMLGKLARWLRILGYDTTYKQDIADGELVRSALDEGRTILTRDTLLVKRLPPGSFLFIMDDAPAGQLRQAVHELGLAVEEARLLSRCVVCNGELYQADKESVRSIVPDYPLNASSRFDRCAGCGKVYWLGTHKTRILTRLQQLGLSKGRLDEIEKDK